ncbi:serine/threonine-protein kinase [Hahella aquimaris]|uniref:serine/threonine-protein kinase n=1 Tax=Hahella sp. HNIBRBA332 TaxID=3015983 RepID=UPI00273BB2E8|nr:serine/threonine-protein kinase [Hahella sp. HNIBRBA332]WLQ12953.1 serine/threonine-protein kinase [Hahella sp. HNIBRBA332]
MSTKPPFDVIGKYSVESTIGQGAMGVVYKGHDPDIDRPVAIKMLHAHLMVDQSDGGLLARFRQEAQAAARCLHTNIVTVFDFGVFKNSPYMVMEFVDGIDLRSFLRENMQLSVRQIGDLVIQVLEALDYAHLKGVVHRDVKPANILLLESGHVKVTDFGVAKLDTSELTNVGDVIGTPSYMSPEALRGDRVDGRSDLFSAGIVLLELIAGKRPQKGGLPWTEKEILQFIADSPTLPVQLDRAFSDLLAKALTADPNDRYETGQEFAIALKTLLAPNQVYVPDLNDLAATVIQSKVTFAGRQADQPSTFSSASSSQIALSPEVSLILSQTLAPFLGPVAHHMIRNAAASSTTLQEMIEKLSRHIPNEVERRNFLNTLNRTGIRSMPSETTGSGASRITTIGSRSSIKPGQAGPLTLSGETLQKLTQLLAHHVGPLASRLVRKSVKNSSDMETLFKDLANSIPDESERTQFISKARKSI